MSGQANRPSARDWVWRRARNFVVSHLLQEARGILSRDPHRVDEAIAKVEQAWRLGGDPDVAVELVTMYDLANQNEDALVVLREAFRCNPHHALLRHHAAITLLRHGSESDIRDFFDSVLKIDPDDAFARFIESLLGNFRAWRDELVAAIRGTQDGRQPFVISCPVWGQPFAANFVRYLCGALLSPNNLPKLAGRRPVHVVVFTTAETEAYLRADPLFACLKDHAFVHFMLYADSQAKYGEAMEVHYGREKVFYSDRSLAFYYARNCKFALMSCAHYAALAAGQVTDALVSCQVADTILNDGALPLMAELLTSRVDAVLVNCIQLDGAVLRTKLDGTCRRADGAVEISRESCTEIVTRHLPDYNFATAANLPQVPLRVCWRVAPDGVLMHGNHYHPMGLRPKALERAPHLTIDPIDSRFIDRSSLEPDRIHVVQDASIVGLSLEEGALPEQLVGGGAGLSIADAAFWLWGYWGRLRGALFKSPLRFGAEGRVEEWAHAEATASAVIDAIVAQAAKWEEGHRRRRLWRL
jgi:hypothetical protein